MGELEDHRSIAAAPDLSGHMERNDGLGKEARAVQSGKEVVDYEPVLRLLHSLYQRLG
jgi:hypothetical protein